MSYNAIFTLLDGLENHHNHPKTSLHELAPWRLETMQGGVGPRQALSWGQERRGDLGLDIRVDDDALAVNIILCR